MLVRAKKYGIINFDGEILFQVCKLKFLLLAKRNKFVHAKGTRRSD